jgi:signal peptidase I
MEQSQKNIFLDALDAFGSCEITVSGESMKPFIQPGDRVFVGRTPHPVQAGHVIAFFSNDQLIIHRVCAIGKGAGGNWIYRVWGDSSPGSLGKINSESVAGRVHHLQRKGRKHALWFQNPLCLLALSLGPLFQAFALLSRLIISKDHRCHL